MVINVIVVAVTLLMGGFVGVWLVCPRCRPWIEAPKWQPLAWDESVQRAISAKAGAGNPVGKTNTPPRT
jgi:hypothetical protein